MIKGLNPGNAGKVVADVFRVVQGEERRDAAKAMIEAMGRKTFKSHKDKDWAKQLIEAAGE